MASVNFKKGIGALLIFFGAGGLVHMHEVPKEMIYYVVFLTMLFLGLGLYLINKGRKEIKEENRRENIK